MLQRIIGVLKLDVNTFEEIEADESATSQAAMIVAAVAVLSAISAFIAATAGNAALDSLEQFGELDLPFAVSTLSPVSAALNALIAAFVTWLLWSALTFVIGTKMFEGEATIGEMLRVIGFAQAPGLLGILGFIPCLGAIIGFVAAIWSIVAGFIAVRQGLDLDNVKTLITIVISWIAAVLVNLIILRPVLGLVGL